MKMNKKGFTLVELLAVIVILAVVMLIGVTAVGPLMTKARKSTLGDEGLGLITAATTAYQAEQLGGGIKPNNTVCFSMAWLKTHLYYTKDDSSYTGSVLVTSEGNGKYKYQFWIGNGVYYYAGKTSEEFNTSGENLAEEGTGSNLNKCGKATIPSGTIDKTA